mgnify:CR=1 FL=1
MEIKEKILKGIERFNKIRKPEAIAEFVGLKNKKVLIKFSGHMCFTYRTYDYFEDLIYKMKNLGINFQLKDYQRKNENYYLATYRLKI